VWSDKFTYKDSVVYHAGNFIAGTNYEAADATILKDADIGVNVQAYSATNALTSDITYERLNTNGDVGTIAGTLAIGNHTHTFASLTSKPTTLSGFGITDAALSTHNHTLDALSNTTITANSTGEILKWSGTAWINNTLAEAGIQPYSATNALTGDITYERLNTNGDVGTTAGTLAIGNHTHTFASLTSKPTTLSGYGITDASLSILTDTTISTPTDGQVLTYDNGTSKWINAAATGGSGTSNYIKKIAAYTAVSGDYILADTSGGTFIITLPITPSVGNFVVIADPENWSTINLTVARNGSTIEGLSEDIIFNTGNIKVSLVYDGGTWRVYVEAIGSSDNFTQQTSSTGSIISPSGTTAQRDGTPSAGYFRFNSDTSAFEGYYGSTWGEVGGGQMLGTATTKAIFYNAQTIGENITIGATQNGMSAGPITVDTGFTVTVSTGAVWTII
jgi:hypothetical protein